MAGTATSLVTITWADRHGNHVQVKFHVDAAIIDPSNALIQSVVTAINAMTHAIGLTIEISKGTTFSNTPGTGPFVVEDKAILVSHDLEGNPHTWKLPAPLDTDFESDNETVDVTAGAVGSLSSMIQANARSQQGGALTLLLKGHRTTSRKPLKH